MRQLILPLERISKKFDHLSVRKTTLSEFIADSTSRINNEGDYQKFKQLLSELRKSINEDKVEAKNNTRINESISELIDSNLYGDILPPVNGVGFLCIHAITASCKGCVLSVLSSSMRLFDACCTAEAISP